MELPISLISGQGWPKPHSAEASHLAAMWHHISLQQDPERTVQNYSGAMLNRLLEHSQRASALWRTRLNHAAGARLKQLPISSRDWIAQQVAQEGALPVQDPWGQARASQTSGSTGRPLSFFVSASAAMVNQWVYGAQNLLSGRDLRQPKTLVTTHDVLERHLPHWPDLPGQLFATGPGRMLEWRGQPIAQLARQLQTQTLGYLLCPGAVVSGLCDHYEVSQTPAPRALEVITRSNAVSAQLRQRVMQLFGAPLSDIYSCEEIGPIAFQCAQAQDCYHLVLSNVVLEIVDDHDQPCAAGQVGRVLLTGLNNLATPFIRYDVGDDAACLPCCPCGWKGPSLTALQGRRSALLKLPGGGQAYTLLHAQAWLPIAPLLEYRLTQDRLDHLLVEVVAASVLSQAQCQALIALTRSRSSEDFAVTLRQVDAIDWGPGRKRNEVQCLV
jgi:phenylacetate-CoA ligase